MIRMRRILALALLFLPILLPAQDGRWRVVDVQEYESGGWFAWRGMTAVDTGRVVAFGDNLHRSAIVRGTTDGGQTWRTMLHDTLIRTGNSEIPLIWPMLIRSLAAPSASLIIAVGDSGSIRRSTDFGVSWTVQRLPGVTTPVRQVSMTDSLNGVITLRERFWTTDDGGVTWTERTDVATSFHPPGYSLSRLSTPDRLTWVALTGAQKQAAIAHTSDAGLSWVMEKQNAASDLFMLDTHLGWTAGCGPYVQGEICHDVIQRTTDGGITWQTTFDGFLPIELRFGLIAVAFANEQEGFVVGRANRIARSVDGGLTWKPEMEGLPDIELFSMTAVACPSPDIAYATAVRGRVLRWDKTSTVGVAATRSPATISQHIEPMPVIGQMRIVLRLAQAENVSLAITRLDGKEVLRPADRFLTAGEHVIPIDCTELPAGLYLARTRVGERVIVSKVIVVK